MADENASAGGGSGDQGGSLRSSGDGTTSSLRSSGDKGDSGSLRQPKDDSTKPAGAAGELEDFERWQILTEIHYYAAVHIEAANAVAEGCLLAVEQVQDKRIELLESPAEPTGIQNPVLAFVLTVTLEGALAPAIAQFALRRVLSVVSRGLGFALAKTAQLESRRTGEIRLFRDLARDAGTTRGRKAGETTKQWREMAQLFEHQAALLDRPKLDYADAARIVRNTLGASERLQLEAVAVAKAVRENAGNTPGDAPSSDTTAGVSLLGVAFQEAANLRLFWKCAELVLDTVLHDPKISSSDAYSALQRFRPTQGDFSKVRTEFAVLAEAVIWGRQLNIPALPRRGDGKYEITGLPRQGVTIDARVKSYLLKRFAQAARAWDQTNPFVLSPSGPVSDTGAPSGGTPLPGDLKIPGPSPGPTSGGFPGGPTDPGPPSLPFDELVMAYLGAVAESDARFSALSS